MNQSTASQTGEQEGFTIMEAVLTHRRSDRAIALAVAASALIWLAAFASPVAAQDPPGNNGTVKIHIGAPTTAHAIEPNNPHVCDFHVHAWNFDENQVLTFTIVGHGGPTAGEGEVSGTITTNIDGEHGWEGSSRHFNANPAAPDLPPGHYKLTVDTGNGTPTQDKHKVFWVECEDTGTGGNNTGGNNTGGSTNTGGGGTAGGSTNTGGAVAGGQGGPAAGGTRGGVLGSQGGPAAGALPDTAVPLELLGSIGGLLVVASGIGYSVNRRRSR